MRLTFTPLLSLAAASLLCLLALPAAAQTALSTELSNPPPAPVTAQPEPLEPEQGRAPANNPSQRTGDRHNQRIERIHFSDRNTEVDELRVGGETKSIQVRPKGSMPAYEVAPAHAGRERHEGNGQGRRSWKALQF